MTGWPKAIGGGDVVRAGQLYDGIHPNDAGHRELARVMCPALVAALARGDRAPSSASAQV